MEKISSYMILFLIFLLTFIHIQAVQTDILSFYCNETIIERVTTRAEFRANLRVRTDSIAENQYIGFKDLKGYDKNSFIKVENVRVLGTNSDKIKFEKDENGNIKDTLEFNIKGNLVFHWNNEKNSNLRQVKLGKVYQKLNSISNGDVEIILDNLEITPILKVNVTNHMDFGTIVAGQKADTKEPWRTPAQLEIEGASGKNVKILIPQTTEIKNQEGDRILVDLRFRNKVEVKEGNNKSITERIKDKGSGDSIGKTDTVVIDGSVTTEKENHGNYKGMFIVRVEYEN
ncbi:DUF4402 domain-containing protein [uncultured Fusobacterium sp.]|uniref:DUF4402 domain-containing protein n=1 Tax=uncultured Fusobacterium sp. TaxID=159267 RepID=UPI0025DED337|nr:DUF4402 domain-containing protein [uncultured Fusobacterium sp.]